MALYITFTETTKFLLGRRHLAVLFGINEVRALTYVSIAVEGSRIVILCSYLFSFILSVGNTMVVAMTRFPFHMNILVDSANYRCGYRVLLFYIIPKHYILY